MIRTMSSNQHQSKRRNGFRVVYFTLLVLFIISCSTSKKTTVPATEAYRPHTVQRGETISKIANTYDVTLVQIAAMNPGLDLNRIKAGQVIKIPFKKEIKNEQVEEKKEPEPVKKSETMHVALLLPFNAAHNMENQVDNAISVDPVSIPWIQLYEGVRLALDSLAAEGNNFELRLYDTWMDSTKLSRLIRDTLFTKNDLVIAGSVTGFLPQLATAAASAHKPLIITQNNSATFLDGHPELLLATPSVALQCKLMSDFIYKEFENENLVILHQDTKKETDLASIFSTALQINRLSSGSTDSLKVNNKIYSDKLFDKGSTMLDKNRKNVIIIPSSDEAFVSPIISRLDSLDEMKFVVCGLPTWENFESIDPKMLQKLQTHIFTSSFIDYNNQHVKNFRRSFIEKYKTDPVHNAFLGFSITYLAATAMEKGEKEFFHQLEKKENRENRELPAKFDFISKSKNDGKENNRITILKFEYFKLVPVE